jgi:hypothetical protein
MDFIWQILLDSFSWCIQNNVYNIYSLINHICDTNGCLIRRKMQSSTEIFTCEVRHGGRHVAENRLTIQCRSHFKILTNYVFPGYKVHKRVSDILWSLTDIEWCLQHVQSIKNK